MENMWNEAKNNTNLRTMFVKEILVEEGDTVKGGQLLMRIE